MKPVDREISNQGRKVFFHSLSFCYHFQSLLFIFLCVHPLKKVEDVIDSSVLLAVPRVCVSNMEEGFIAVLCRLKEKFVRYIFLGACASASVSLSLPLQHQHPPGIVVMYLSGIPGTTYLPFVTAADNHVYSFTTVFPRVVLRNTCCGTQHLSNFFYFLLSGVRRKTSLLIAAVLLFALHNGFPNTSSLLIKRRWIAFLHSYCPLFIVSVWSLCVLAARDRYSVSTCTYGLLMYFWKP